MNFTSLHQCFLILKREKAKGYAGALQIQIPKNMRKYPNQKQYVSYFRYSQNQFLTKNNKVAEQRLN